MKLPNATASLAVRPACRAVAALLMAGTMAAGGGAAAHDTKGHDKAHGNAKHASAHKEQKPWGIAGDAKAVRRTIQIEMRDTMRFSPEVIEVREGETVRLAIRNSGKMLHELVIGTKKELDEHAVLMVKFPNMEHDEPYMAHVSAGKRGDIVWHFNRAGEFDFACLIAGHYQAGMVGKIRVLPASGGKK